MIKFVMCITRHPNMAREEFKEYWMNKHGPFFMNNADTMAAKKYVQSHTMETPLNKGLRTSRDKLLEMLAQRVDDRRFLRLISKWLKEGILVEDKSIHYPEEGTPQGGLCKALHNPPYA